MLNVRLICCIICVLWRNFQVAEVSSLLQGLQWVVLEDTRHWGLDVKTIDLAFTVRLELY